MSHKHIEFLKRRSLFTFETFDYRYILKLNLIIGLNTSDPILFHLRQFSTVLTEQSFTNQNSMVKILLVILSQNFSICKSNPSFCNQGFYGPVLSNVSEIGGGLNYSYYDIFYASPADIQDFSIISNQEFEISEEEYKSFNPKSFVIGLFD